jgi:Ca2+-binding RTX toxin-like protein
MRALLRSLLGARPASPRRPSRLGVEPLEERAVPALSGLDWFTVTDSWYSFRWDWGSASYDPYSRTIAIRGSEWDDGVTVRQVRNGYWPQDRIVVEVNGTTWVDQPLWTERTYERFRWHERNVQWISFEGRGGNDVYENRSQVSSTAYGGYGNDTLCGGEATDYLMGDADNDQLYGGHYTEYQPLTLSGSFAFDDEFALTGDDGEFTMTDNITGFDWGGELDAAALPAPAVQRIASPSGSDVLHGGDGYDSLTGGDGIDWLYGGNHDDLLQGEAGDDKLYGGDGWWDQLQGGPGADFLDRGSSWSWWEPVDGGPGRDFDAYAPVFAGTTMEDVIQGEDGNCMDVAKLASVARTGTVDLAGGIAYLGNSVYRVRVFRMNGNGDVWQTYQDVYFDGTISPGEMQPRGDQEEFWTVLYQRAVYQEYQYTSWFYGGGAQLARPENTFVTLTGRKGEFLTSYDDYAFFKIAWAVGFKGRDVMAGTPELPGDAPPVHPTLANDHAYTVTAAWIGADGVRYLTVRNPWGEDGGARASGDPSDGLITLTWAEYQRCFDATWIA